jgi:hypothetical protein
MPPVKLLIAAAFCAALLSACGNESKPLAGTGGGTEKLHGRGVVDDPRTTETAHLKCLQQAKLPVTKVGATGLQIGPLPAGPTVMFEPTPGIAQGLQIQGRVEGAEVIGAALLFPNQASDKELKTVEGCLAKGVSG